jgi:integrase
LVERIFEAHVKPAIGKRPLAELRRAHLVELLDDLQNEKGLRAQVNRVRSQVIAALNWAVEHELLDSNPAATIRKRRLEVSRDRVLTGQELRSIWKAAEALPEPSGSFVQVLILTAQRRDECRCMTWHEIDRPQALWLLPAGRNKSNRDHEIPLPPTIVKLLDRLKRLGEQVFTIDGERPYSGQKRLAAILVRNSGVTGWCFHDLRRTAASGMAALGVSIDVIERVLNHAKPGLVGVYNRHTYRSEMRAALEAWADHVAAVVAGAPAAWDEPAEPRQISRAAA